MRGTTGMVALRERHPQHGTLVPVRPGAEGMTASERPRGLDLDDDPAASGGTGRYSGRAEVGSPACCRV